MGRQSQYQDICRQCKKPTCNITTHLVHSNGYLCKECEKKELEKIENPVYRQ